MLIYYDLLGSHVISLAKLVCRTMCTGFVIDKSDISVVDRVIKRLISETTTERMERCIKMGK